MQPQRDSHQKYADSLFGTDRKNPLFNRVHPADLDEVRCQFAIWLRDAKHPVNQRIYPLNQAIQFHNGADKYTASVPDDYRHEHHVSQVKTKSGRIYWIGYTDDFRAVTFAANHQQFKEAA